MDLTTAIVTTIQALAWPVAILGGVLVLRREIRALLERISQIKYKDLQIGIREGLGKTREVLTSSSTTEEPRQPLAAVEDEKDVAALMNLAQASPRNAIIEGWRLLQDLLVEPWDIAHPRPAQFGQLPWPNLPPIPLSSPVGELEFSLDIWVRCAAGHSHRSLCGKVQIPQRRTAKPTDMHHRQPHYCGVSNPHRW